MSPLCSATIVIKICTIGRMYQHVCTMYIEHLNTNDLDLNKPEASFNLEISERLAVARHLKSEIKPCLCKWSTGMNRIGLYSTKED